MTLRSLPQTILLDAFGDGSMSFEVDNATVMWDIAQIAVGTSPTISTCTAQINLDFNYHCSTVAGSGDTAQGPPDIHLYPGQRLEIFWANGPANGIAKATLYYDELPR